MNGLGISDQRLTNGENRGGKSIFPAPDVLVTQRQTEVSL
ncbi:hypothetical protein BH23PAT1_BH23PAT1_1100 [soil metagenome]